jgi:hypothetical protein
MSDCCEAHEILARIEEMQAWLVAHDLDPRPDV